MKRCLFVMGWMAALAFLFSCGGREEGFDLPDSEAHLALAEIDSLMWRQPDSAFANLMDFASNHDTDSLEEFDRHYFQLLISELLYKNDYRQSNRMELLQTVDYLDSLMEFGIISFLDARAHYIKGVGYYEHDSLVEACTEYLKAIEVMEEWFEEKDLVGKKAQSMIYSYNRLMELFSSQYMMEPAIACGNSALSFSKRGTLSPLGISNLLYFIGKEYDKMGKTETAVWYYQQALEALPDTNNLVYRNIVSNQALGEYQLGAGLKCSLSKIRLILIQSGGESERLNRYVTIGGIFFNEQAYDSACYYLEQVFENTTERTLQILAADYLRVIYDSLGDKEKSETYMRFLGSGEDFRGCSPPGQKEA